jgi:beta-lactamase regulating signal transducer with metallopeptidase domain
LAGKIVLWALRGRSAQARYLAGCATMACLVLAPLATFYRLSSSRSIPGPRSAQTELPARSAPARLDNSHRTGPSVIVRVARQAPGPLAGICDGVEASLPWFLLVWASGVVLLAARLVAGWCQVHRWTRGRRALSVPGWEERLGKLAMRLTVTRPVRLLQSALVEVPTVLGWLRPIVLLPASCLTGLSSRQLEAILAHELAHIRRHDYLVNVLQRMVETLLFYHPAVWSVSGQIRIEREHCCDDWVVAACGDRVGYARALASLERMRDASGQFALAAAGRPLLTRIRRLLGKPVESRFDGGWIAGMLAVAALALSLVAGRGVLLAQAQRQPETAPQTERKDSAAAFPEPTASNPAKAEVTETHSERAVPNLSGRQFIYRKLDKIIVDEISYEQATLRNVVADLNELARKNDPAGIGVNFIFNPNLAASSAAPQTHGTAAVQPKAIDLGQCRVTLHLQKVRLAEVIDAVVKAAAPPIQYSVQPYAVVFTLADPERPQLLTRSYKLSLDAFQKYFERQERALLGKPQEDGAVLQTLGVVLRRPGPKPPMSELFRLFFVGAGVDFLTNTFTSVPAPFADKTFKALFFNEQTGLLLARATVPELDTVEKAIQLVAAERPQVSIEIKFTEIDPDELPALGLDSLFDLKSAALPITITNWNGIVTDPHAFDPGKNIQDFINPTAELLAGTARVVAPAQARAILERIRGDILCAPRIITLTGQRAQVQVVEPTNSVVREQLESLSRTTGSFAFTKAAPLGTSVDLMLYVSADGLTIQLTATPCVTEFLGYDDPGPFQPASDGDGKPLVASLPLPRFRARQVTVNAVIPDGHTLVIAGFGPLEAAQPDQPNEKKKSLSKPEKQLLIFLTPTIIDARGNRVHPD